MNTIYLDPSAWDFVLDISGNIALASEPYALAQDAASNIRTFESEVYYDTTQGVPYLQEILGYPPNIPFLKADYVAQALLVPDVAAAQVFISSIVNRTAKGQVQISTNSGAFAAANF